MTRPDVTALAAALMKVLELRYEPEFDGEDTGSVAGRDAEAIIAALAAQGWHLRLASGASEQLDRIEADYEARVAASNARIAELSAQAAAPHVWVDDRGVATGGNVLPQTAPEQRLQAAWQTWLDERRRIEQAAVRVALEGLRAEVAGLSLPLSRDAHDWTRHERDAFIATIDARLADLP